MYAIEWRTHPEANENPFPVTYYCYESECPGRHKHNGASHMEGTFKWIKVISKKNKTYRRKRWCCDYCGNIMTGTVSIYAFG